MKTLISNYKQKVYHEDVDKKKKYLESVKAIRRWRSRSSTKLINQGMVIKFSDSIGWNKG